MDQSIDTDNRPEKLRVFGGSLNQYEQNYHRGSERIPDKSDQLVNKDRSFTPKHPVNMPLYNEQRYRGYDRKHQPSSLITDMLIDHNCDPQTKQLEYYRYVECDQQKKLSIYSHSYNPLERRPSVNIAHS